MVKRILFLILGFYFLVLFQSSFLISFSYFGFLPNLVLLLIVLLNFISSLWFGLTSAFIGGFYLDIFSLSPFFFFGSYTLIALILAVLVQFVFQRYVRFSVSKK